MATVDKTKIAKAGKIGKPRLERIGLIKAVLQGYRVRLDEELQPHGITTAQLRLLWTVEANPEANGSQVARMCSVTPQTGQAAMARMEANGWIRRRAPGGRVLMAEMTAKGRRVLLQGREIAERVDRELWDGIAQWELAGMEAALGTAVGKLER